MNTSPTVKASWAIAAFAVLAALPATAQSTLFTDTFTDNLDGWYFTNTSGSGTAWDRGNYTDTLPPISDQALRNLGGTTANSRAHRHFAADAVTLAAEGDYIQLDLDFSSTATSSAFAVALYNTATPYTGNDFGGNLVPTDTQGYRFDQGWTATNYVYRELSGTGASVLDTLTNNIEDINDAVGNTLSFRITRVATGIQLDTVINSVTYDSVIDTTPISYTFNSLYVHSGNTAIVDNVSVVSSIPEPASAAFLFGAALISFVFVRRRR